jgi:GTP-binding protein
LGQERNIVTDQAGTTRDSIDTVYNQYGFEFVLVDTAGIRKKSKVKENIEFYSVMRALRSIEYSDVCLLLFDATRTFDSQVNNIFWLAARNHKGIVILVNHPRGNCSFCRCPHCFYFKSHQTTCV